MLTVKRGKSIFHFVLRNPKGGGGSERPVQPAGHSSMQFWFGTTLSAESFLRDFASDRSAGIGMSALLTTLGGVPRFNVPSKNWIEELAPLLVSGNLQVTEMRPKLKGEGTKSQKGKEGPLVVPRKAPVVEKAEAVAASTFPLLDEDQQANALIVASQAGAAFCEVCSKA